MIELLVSDLESLKENKHQEYCIMYNSEKRVCKQTGKIPDCCNGKGDYNSCLQVTSIIRCAEMIAGIRK